MSEERKFHNQFLTSWLKGYQKAIIESGHFYPKTVIDTACYHAVVNWTTCLYEEKRIKEIRGQDFETYKECIDHHIENLKIGGYWEKKLPLVTQINSYKNIEINGALVTVPECDLKISCSINLIEYKKMSKKELFPCQRIGCFAAAVKLYLQENGLNGLDRENITYYMLNILNKDGCTGIVFIKDKMNAFMLRNLLTD